MKLTMQRMVLERRYDDPAQIDTTPLRGNFVSLPRRLIFKYFSPEQSSGEKVLSSGLMPHNDFIVEERVTAHEQGLVGDRFISHRSGMNIGASHYHLTRKSEKQEDEHELKLFEQIEALTSDYRKRVMNQAMQETDIIPGVRQRKILNLHRLATEDGNKHGNRIEGSNTNCWQCRPRKKPLIGSSNKGREASGTIYQQFPQIFRFPFLIRGRFLVDWGARNFIVMAVDDAVGIFDANMPLTLRCERYDNDGQVKIVKWSNDGGIFAVGRSDSTISISKIEKNNKIVWIRHCDCRRKRRTKCEISYICWSSNDKIIIAGCSSGRLTNYDAATGKKQKCISCETEIVYFTLSPNDRFLALSLQDTTVKLYAWPSFEPYMNIRYYKRVKALAWHPWDSKILCVGGGFCDGSLTIWNVNTQTPLQYRRIDFTGAVENLTFNKISGELIVQWTYWERDRRFAKIAILASLDRVVDVIPVEKRIRIWNLLWNPDHTRMAIPCADTLVIWDIFGREEHKVKNEKKRPSSKFLHEFPSGCGLGPTMVDAHFGKGLNYYNIR
ncbi:protein cortex-like [Belonocnema kinseyi]|uniref:protein cortex-like n=1 Tax=Belonocnema kinseyi TaxID=2817044 RepID=UPI00143D5238|nr:protein cortex-like [Belonocnema kinseyi]